MSSMGRLVDSSPGLRSPMAMSPCPESGHAFSHSGPCVSSTLYLSSKRNRYQTEPLALCGRVATTITSRSKLLSLERTEADYVNRRVHCEPATRLSCRDPLNPPPRFSLTDGNWAVQKTLKILRKSTQKNKGLLLYTQEVIHEQIAITTRTRSRGAPAGLRNRQVSRHQSVACLPADQLWRAADRAYRSEPSNSHSSRKRTCGCQCGRRNAARLIQGKSRST